MLDITKLLNEIAAYSVEKCVAVICLAAVSLT